MQTPDASFPPAVGLNVVVAMTNFPVLVRIRIDDNLGTEILIDAVKEREALWDTSSQDYKDKNLKKALWMEICQTIHPNFEEMDVNSRTEIVKDVQKKWKHIRDAYIRSLRDQKNKSGQDRKSLKTYVYARRLQFLKLSKALQDTDSSRKSEIEEKTEEEHIEENSDLEENFCTETLIDAVKERKALWDTSSEDYKDKNLKKALWIETCQMVYPNFEEMDENSRIEIGKEIQKKWKHIRDAYNRSLRGKKRKFGQKRKFLKKYVYASQLQFLEEAKALHEAESSVHSEIEVKTEEEYIEEGDSDIMELTEQKPFEWSASNQHINNKKTPESAVENYNDSVQHQNQEQRCDDLEFFQSMLPFVKNIPMHRKLQFRMDIMKTVMQYTQSSQEPF